MPQIQPMRHRDVLVLASTPCRFFNVFVFLLTVIFVSVTVSETHAYRFVSMGDSRGCHLDSLINETVLGQVNQQISALNPAAEFTVFLGDMSYRGDIPSGGIDHYTYSG